MPESSELVKGIKIWFVFWKPEPQYACKPYAYKTKKHVIEFILLLINLNWLSISS